MMNSLEIERSSKKKECFIYHSFFKDFFYYLNLQNYYRMFSWIFTLIYGYMVSQMIKTSGCLDKSSYYDQSPIGFIYDMLNMIAYSVCLYFMSNLQNVEDNRYNFDCLLYWIPYTTSVVGFAALGEISWLRRLAITWGFWERLSNKAVNFLLISSIIFIAFAGYQVRRACREQKFKQLLAPTLTVGAIYSLSWIILDKFENANSILHLHHAFLAAVFSLWFSNWSNQSAVIWHAINIGVWVEGWNIYGTQEMHIFMEAKDGNNLSFEWSCILCIGMILVALLSYIKGCFYIKSRAKYRLHNSVYVIN